MSPVGNMKPDGSSGDWDYKMPMSFRSSKYHSATSALISHPTRVDARNQLKVEGKLANKKGMTQVESSAKNTRAEANIKIIFRDMFIFNTQNDSLARLLWHNG
jgi:hypothetical protein